MEFDDDSANWRKSSIREWMNGPFYSQAFSNEEKDAVIKTSVDNSVRQRLSNWPSDSDDETTEDYVFLLSSLFLDFSGNHVCHIDTSVQPVGKPVRCILIFSVSSIRVIRQIKHFFGIAVV